MDFYNTNMKNYFKFHNLHYYKNDTFEDYFN
jgi:hypothetical protein